MPSQSAYGPRKQAVQPADCPCRHVVEERLHSPNFFGATTHDTYFGKLKFPAYLGKKGGLLSTGLNQNDGKLGAEELQSQSGKAGSAANVGQPTRDDRNGVGCVQRLAKMPLDDLSRVGDRRQVNLLIPQE